MSSAPITFSGLGSGFDTSSIVTKLVAAEKIPETIINQEKTNASTQLSTVGSIVSGLQALQATSDPMTTALGVNPLTAISSNNAIVSTSATSAASPGSYNLVVGALAQAQTSQSALFASDAAPAGGSLKLTVGATSTLPITYNASDTLESIAGNINQAAANAGIKALASVIFDGSKYSLMISSTQTGLANSISFADTGANGLGLNGQNNSNAVQPAKDASFTLNNVALTRSTNSFSDVVTGVTFNLTGTGTASVNVAPDLNALHGKIQSMVDAFNAVGKQLTGQLNFTGQTVGTDTLFGDSDLERLQSQLATAFTQGYMHKGQNFSPLQIGISVDKYGVATFDSSKFDSAVAADPTIGTDMIYGAGAGMAQAVSNVVQNFTAPVTGILVAKQTSITNQMTSYDKQIQTIEDQAASLQADLTAQFATLDSVMAAYQQQSTYIAQINGLTTSLASTSTTTTNKP